MSIISTKQSLIRTFKTLEAVKGIFRILIYVNMVLQAGSLFLYFAGVEQNKMFCIGIIGCGIVCTLVYMLSTEMEEHMIARYLIRHKLSSVYEIFNSADNITMGL